MNTLKIVIVDDEMRIGKLISKLIHYDEANMELLAVFNSSVEAYDYIVRENPDVVITDIQMPVIDGLELIRKIKDKGLQSHFIVISGYHEFEYARTALKYGVEDYLLKPVKEDELNKILLQVSQEHNESVIRNTQTEELKKSAKRERELVGRDALIQLYQQQYLDSVESFNELYYTHFKNALFLPFIVKIDYPNETGFYSTKDVVLVRNIISTINSKVSGVCFEQSYAVIRTGEIVGLLNFDNDNSKELLKIIKECFVDIKDHIGTMFDAKVTMIISDSVIFEHINQEIKKLESGVSERLLLGVDRIITVDKYIAESKYTFDANLETRIQKSVLSFNSDDMKMLISEAYKKLKDSNAEAGSYIKLAEVIINSFFSAFTQSPQVDEEKKDVQRFIYDCYSVDMLVNYLKDETNRFLNEMSKSYEKRTRKPIREAINYINEHYSEKITLEEISESAEMNTSYFSTLFKKETGENFQNYLTKVRIEKAKELLMTTNATMAEIAMKVGYMDTRYFSQSFMKIVGIKPSLYRKMHS